MNKYFIKLVEICMAANIIIFSEFILVSIILSIASTQTFRSLAHVNNGRHAQREISEVSNISCEFVSLEQSFTQLAKLVSHKNKSKHKHYAKLVCENIYKEFI